MNPYIEKFKKLRCYQDVMDAVKVNISVKPDVEIVTPYVEKPKKLKHFPRQVTQAMAMIAEIRRTLKESKEDERELCLLDYDSNNDIFPILAAHLLKFRHVFVVKSNRMTYIYPHVERLDYMGDLDDHVCMPFFEKLYRIAYDTNLNSAQAISTMVSKTFVVSIQPNDSRHQIQQFGVYTKQGLRHWLINLEQYDKSKHGRLPKQEWFGYDGVFMTYEKFAYSVLAKAETFTSRSITDMRLFYDDNIRSRWNAIVRIK